MISNSITALSSITFDQFAMLVQEHQYLIALLSPLLTGEMTIHVFGILNGSGDISLLPTLIALAAMVLFDVYSIRRRENTETK